LEKSSVFNLCLKEPRLVADLVLIESLFQTAGAATEKEREANEVEADGWCRS